MRPIQSLPLEEYYLWKRKVETQYPWQRQFLNSEFLKYEIKRTKDCQDWYKKFLKSGNNSGLGVASFYIVPMEISSPWKAAIADLGNFNYVGLSALFNSPSVTVTALIPYTIKQPQEYRLIEIIKSKRMNIVNRRLNMVEPVAIIDSWDYLKSDSIYVDVPYEKKIIQNVLSENLIDNDQISLSFQSPIISAPYVDGSIGGISLSSISGDSAFAKELLKTIQQVVPPEYRTLIPPKSAYNGHTFPYLEGIGFHLAERPYLDHNIFSTLYAKQYPILENEQSQRYKFNGEFSIFSTFNPDEGNVTQIWKESLKNFNATEVTLPWEIDELIEWDVDLRRLKRVVSEDLWMQVVNARQCMPRMNADADNDFIKTINLLKADLDTLLSDVNKQAESREYLISSMMHQLSYNLKRVAQSIARADENDLLDGKHLKKARGLIIDNFTGFIHHPRFHLVKSRMESKKEDARFSVIQTEIINHPRSSTAEIFEAIKTTKLFKDIYDLQELLDWLHRRGHMIIDSNKRYIWVGIK